MKQFITLPKLKKGDKVAILSPSNGLPGLFPWVQDLGLKRIREDFGLEPVEYPTTRQMGSSLEDRARDIMAAFGDSGIKGVIASIGGSDQIKLIRFLDAKVFLDNPKPFFGFSDNTHLHNYLWNLGIPSFYGGAVMTQYAMQRAMHGLTADSLKAALFTNNIYEARASSEYNDIGLDWADEATLNQKRTMEPNEGYIWDGKTEAKGILWGGCVESLIAQSTASIYLPKDEDLENTILFLETSEGIPRHWVVQYLLNGFGERGWLNKFQAVLVGRPKAWDFGEQNSTEQKQAYREKQRETILAAVRQYNRTIPVIQNMDFGHTDPQIVLPSGRLAEVNTSKKQILLHY